MLTYICEKNSLSKTGDLPYNISSDVYNFLNM